MGNERKGYKRMTFFLQNNIALQVAENAYQERETLTEYITGAILKRIKDERLQKTQRCSKKCVDIAKKSSHTTQPSDEILNFATFSATGATNKNQRSTYAPEKSRE